MSVPCRSSTCHHLQCFDAATYLQMNEKKSTWLCPVCDKPAEYDSLIIDGYVCMHQMRQPLAVHRIQNFQIRQDPDPEMLDPARSIASFFITLWWPKRPPGPPNWTEWWCWICLDMVLDLIHKILWISSRIWIWIRCTRNSYRFMLWTYYCT